MKVGFSLMPIALEGLGRISHLINIDTVEDLVVLMKTVLTCKNWIIRINLMNVLSVEYCSLLSN